MLLLLLLLSGGGRRLRWRGTGGGSGSGAGGAGLTTLRLLLPRRVPAGAATQATAEVQRRVLLDLVVSKSARLQLLAAEEDALRAGRHARLGLDLGLDVVDRFVGRAVESEPLVAQWAHPQLHAVVTRRDW